MLRTIVCLVLGALLWGGSVLALQQQDQLRREDRTRYIVPPLEAILPVATDFENVIADSYWLLFLQMNGENLTIEDEAKRDYQHAYPTLAVIMGLDPQFHEAAIFGSWALADGDRLDEALDLMRAGMRRHPENYRYPYQMGVLEFLYGRRYLDAARYFEQAAELPGAPAGTRRFAARMYEKGNKTELAIGTWRAIYENARDEQSRTIAKRALEKLGVTL